MKIILVFIFLFSLNLAVASKPDTTSNASAKASEPEFNEKEFQKLMRSWNEKIKSLEEGKVPSGIFQIAEKIIVMNPDQFLNLAEDLSRFTAKGSKLLVPLKKQWLPLSLNPVFLGSANETLFETAERLANDGNG